MQEQAGEEVQVMSTAVGEVVEEVSMATEAHHETDPGDEVELNSDGEEMDEYDCRLGSLNEELAAQFEQAKLLQRQEEKEEAAARGRARSSRQRGVVCTVNCLPLQGGLYRWEKGQVDAEFQDWTTQDFARLQVVMHGMHAGDPYRSGRTDDFMYKSMYCTQASPLAM